MNVRDVRDVDLSCSTAIEHLYITYHNISVTQGRFTWHQGLGPLYLRINVESWRRRAPQCSEPVLLTAANEAWLQAQWAMDGYGWPWLFYTYGHNLWHPITGKIRHGEPI